MELSARQAATLLNRNLRTVRGQLARGELPGTKKNGRWVIRREDLPLTEAQRRGLQRKADRIRKTVEGVLPSRLARRPGDRSRSLVDLDVFRLGAELLNEIRKSGDVLDRPLRERVEASLEEALLDSAEASFQYDRRLKLAALNQARGALARTSARLLLAAGFTPEDPVARWVQALEHDILPAVAGFARWTDSLGRKPS